MPYTPPSQQSPASSKTSSPALSRSTSYSNEQAVRSPLSPSSPRPSLPRSISSATYLSKHRRSPSITKDDVAIPSSPDGLKFAASHIENAHAVSTNGSIRQSPPPLNNLLIPTGAVISPPDSSENSDGDERPSTKAEELRRTWGELEQAVRSIELKREPSPVRMRHAGGAEHHSTRSEPTTTITSPTALSPEARKISHSRSSTATSIVRPDLTESPMQTSDDSDDEDSLRVKPPLVRKKSGELVKPALRPSSRRRYSSMPGTPTYHKSVHFNDDGNQTRHFLQVDKPMAVSAGSSPVETYDSESEYPFEDRSPTKVEWDIKLANFPEDTFERKAKPVRVERFFLSGDSKSLIGTVAVANLAFNKLVIARFTLDYWKTTSEVVAEFSNDVRRQQPDDGLDRFNFSIRLADQANLENKTLLLCIRYNVNGVDYWDNNDNMNYQIDFVKKTQKSPQSTLGARPLNAIPRSRHSPPTSRGRVPSIDDDLVTRFDSTSSAYHFGSPAKLIGESPNTTVKLKPRSKRGSLYPTASQPNNGLGGRYDFGASLSAALSNAQDKLGKQSGLMGVKAPKTESGYFSPQDARQGPAQERPDAITTDRPAMGSEQYKDLVQKFCYFTPTTAGKTSPQGSAPASKPASTDGAQDNGSVSDNYSIRSSGTVTPSPANGSPMVDGASDKMHHISTFSARSQSPATVAGIGARTASPVSFGYPYRQNVRDGYLSDSPAPTAIRG